LDRKVILFDCMETLVDMTEIPGEKEYALWAWEGSGVESYWKESEEFIEQFAAMRKILKQTVPYHKEYSLSQRLQYIVERHLGYSKEKKELQLDKADEARGKEVKEIVDILVNHFWHRYKEKCYVSKEVRQTLNALSEEYEIGIVSNFLIQGGVEALIKTHELQKNIQFIVTSVSEGWRKPHPEIYRTAIKQSEVARVGDILFIGDDYLNDYIVPQKLGMKALLYDRHNRNFQRESRFTAFPELKDRIREIYRKELNPIDKQ